MTELEARKLLAILYSTYKREFYNTSQQEVDITAKLWHRAFENIPYEKVSAALERYIFTDKSGFAPKIGHINGILSETDKPIQIGSASDSAHSASFRKSIQEWERLWDLGLDPITMKPRNTQPYWRET